MAITKIGIKKLTAKNMKEIGPILCYGDRVSIHPCNVNQFDVLFILSLFRQSTSTCFGHICSPTSGDILCI